MSYTEDGLFDLLPVVHRQRDAEVGWPLRGLLHLMGEQADVVEADIAQLYENWFIETGQDWIVPYIGALIGYEPVHEAGEPGDVTTAAGQQLNKILIPRREVANTIRYRRRKGALALLELLARDVADWPARAVEFYKLLGWTQAMNHLRPYQGQTVDMRSGEALDLIDSPFDRTAHSIDVRRISSHREQGRYNIPNVGVFVWRLRAYSVTQTPAYFLEELGSPCYTFSVLGNDTPLYTNPVVEALPTDIAGELNVPSPIRRRAFESHLTDYYGAGKSLQIWVSDRQDGDLRAVPPEGIIAADLTDWQYAPPPGKLAVDPQLGRIALAPRSAPKGGLWVTYHYGFSADMGGGEYGRTLSQPADAIVYRIVSNPGDAQREFKRIAEAIRKWEEERPLNAVIEIAESNAYVDQINITLQEHQSLQLRAANGVRPVIRLLDYRTAGPDALRVDGAPGGRFLLDGVLIAGRGVQVNGDLREVTIRHSTLVPGWTLKHDCEPAKPTEPSLVLNDTNACIHIQYSIIGSIQVNQDEVMTDSIPIHINDSILDATETELEALGAPRWPLAHATLTIQNTTVIGTVQIHAISLADNCIFDGLVTVARRQLGCMRFCYVTPGSRTPRRYNCQPDLVESIVEADYPPGIERETARERERLRVEPQFNSTRYGTPTYCQLAPTCAAEISSGAEDESEMGAFYHLYQPQRAANLRTRLNEYTPAGMDVGIIIAS